MSVMYLLIAFSLLIASAFLLAFIWAMKNGQYEDKYTPSVRILFDDAPNGNASSETASTSEKNSQTSHEHPNKS